MRRFSEHLEGLREVVIPYGSTRMEVVARWVMIGGVATGVAAGILGITDDLEARSANQDAINALSPREKAAAYHDAAENFEEAIRHYAVSAGGFAMGLAGVGAEKVLDRRRSMKLEKSLADRRHT